MFSAPRSGSTWLSEVLTHEDQIRLVHEPDNELNSYYGLYHKIGLPRFPFLREDDSNDAYKNLFHTALHHFIADQGDWQNKLVKKLYGLSKEKLQRNLIDDGTALQSPIMFSKFWNRLVIGNRPETKTLVKTVHASLAIPFLVKNLEFIPVILNRHPLNVYSSYVNMNMPDGNRKLYENKALLEHFDVKRIDSPENFSSSYLAGYQLGLFGKAHSSYRSISEIVFLDYEEIISAPFENMEKICGQLKLPFTEKTVKFMESKFTKGKGYDTNRDLEGLDAVWKKRLSTTQIDEFLKGYEFAYGSINFDV